MNPSTNTIQETLEHKKHSEDWGLLLGRKLTRTLRSTRRRPLRRASFVDGEATAPLVPTRMHKKKREDPGKPGVKEVFTRQSTIALISYSFLALHSVAFDQVLPVFLNYPVAEHTPENTSLPIHFTGGYGLGSGKIGTIFTVYGITCGLIQFIIFPPLCMAFGSQKLIRACSKLLPDHTYPKKLLLTKAQPSPSPSSTS